jgi:hypothetical protein
MVGRLDGFVVDFGMGSSSSLSGVAGRTLIIGGRGALLGFCNGESATISSDLFGGVDGCNASSGISDCAFINDFCDDKGCGWADLAPC